MRRVFVTCVVAAVNGQWIGRLEPFGVPVETAFGVTAPEATRCSVCRGSFWGAFQPLIDVLLVKRVC